MRELTLTWYVKWMRELGQSFGALEETPLELLLDIELVQSRAEDKLVWIEDVI